MKFKDLPKEIEILWLRTTLKLYVNPRYCGYYNGEKWFAKCRKKGELIEWYKEYVSNRSQVNFINTYDD